MAKRKRSKDKGNYSNITKQKNKELRINRDIKFKTELVSKKRRRIINNLKLLGINVDESQTLKKLRNILNKRRKLITAKVT